MSGASAPLSSRASSFLSATSALSSDDHIPAAAIYPPNLHLLSEPPSDPAQAVSPSYQTTPAPMGLADFGLGPGGSTYDVYASDVLGTLQLNAYNATAGPLYEDTASYYWDYENPYQELTPWQSGIQLNTVVANISYPGADNGSFWTQNVVDFDGPSLQLVDNIWNFSNPWADLWPGTFYSYDGFAEYPEFYYDYGPTLPAVFPMTIQLYNNASIVDGRSAVSFGYRITEPEAVYTGVYDEVVFNSTPNASVPLLTPDYLVSGTNLTPVGLLYDAELVFGGPGDGSNAVVNSLNGSETLSYLTAGGWTPAPAAYDYGTDTGETSIGLAGWYAGSTEGIDQGPSLLYGLWNTTGGVPTGNIAVDLHLEPAYQFVFIGEDGTDLDNESYAPATAAGTLQTWLPPGTYNLSGWADGFDTGLGQFDSALSGTLGLVSDPGVWDAPIYLNGPAQGEAVATDLTGWSGSGPLSFANLTLNLSLVFNHLNDFGYTEFSVFWAYGIVAPGLSVSNISQGPNLGGETLYVADGTVLNIPDLGDTLQAWDVPAPTFSDLSLTGVELSGPEEGGAVAVWDAPGASADEVNSTNDSFGFWAADSPDVVDSDSTATGYGFALSVVASPDALGTNLVANWLGYGVFSEGSDNATYVNLQALDYSIGLFSFASNGTRISNVTTDVWSTGVDLQSGDNISVADVAANSSALGVLGDGTNGISITSMNVTTAPGDYQTFGAIFNGGNWTNLTDLSTNNSVGVEFLGGANESLANFNASDGAIGAFVIQTDGPVSVENLTADNALGVFFEFNQAPVSADDITAVDQGIGIVSFLTTSVSYSQIVANAGFGGGETTFGVALAYATDSTVTGVEAEGQAIGVNITDSSDTTVTGVSAYDGAAGVVADPSNGVFVSNVYANDSAAAVVADRSSDLVLNNLTADGAYGALLEQASSVWIGDVTALQGSVGVMGREVTDASVNTTSALNGSLGVGLLASSDLWVNGTTAEGGSIGVGLESSSDAWVTGVEARDSNVSSPYTYSPFDVPTAAVVTEDTEGVTLSDIGAVGYPAGLYDVGSSGLTVNDLNASYGDYGAILNGTSHSLLYDLSLVSNAVEGLQLNRGATANVVTQSEFIGNVGFGVDLESGTSNLVYDNSFVGNHGAGSAYNASHIQAFSASASNAFNSTTGIGNYWADWHSYVDGVLAPYYVGTGAFDYHPLGAPEGSIEVTFSETGLEPGTPWSVTIGGATLTSASSTLTVPEFPGSYSFSAGPVAGYAVTPSGGTVVAVSTPVEVALTYAPIEDVTFVASGLPGGTTWTVYLNGVAGSTSSASVEFHVPAGSYGYTVVPPAGWSVAPVSGSIDVAGPFTVPLTFSSTAVPTVDVTVEEDGLAGSFTVLFGGVGYASSGSSVSFSVDAGTYAYQIEPVAGYTASPSSGTVTLSGASYLLWVTFTQVTYPVTFAETGLPTGTTWSVEVGDATYTTSGPSITALLPNGTTDFQFGAVSGYSISTASSTGSVTVAGAPSAVSGAYTANSVPSYVGAATFEREWAIVLGVAVVALGVAALALVRRPRTGAPARGPVGTPETSEAPPSGPSGADAGWGR